MDSFRVFRKKVSGIPIIQKTKTLKHCIAIELYTKLFHFSRFALLILNTEIEDGSKAWELWERASFRVLVDGGANRLHKLATTTGRNLSGVQNIWVKIKCSTFWPQVSKRCVESERLMTTFVTQQRGLFLF